MGTVYEQSIRQTLVTADTATHNQLIMVIVDTLDLADSDDDHYNLQHTNHVFGIAQQLTYSFSGSKSLSHTLVLGQSLTPGVIQQIYQGLLLTQSIAHDYHDVKQTLGFTETISSSKAIAAWNYDLVFTGSVHGKLIKNYHLTDTLGLVGTASVFKYDWRYVAGPVYPIVKHSFVTFTSNDGKGTVSLRPPDFGNKDTTASRRIQRETRNGDLIIYRDPTWSRDEQFELTFSYIDEKTALKLQKLVQDTLGLLITYVDHEGNSWTGVFNSPDLAITTPGRFNDSFTIKFEVIDES